MLDPHTLGARAGASHRPPAGWRRRPRSGACARVSTPGSQPGGGGRRYHRPVSDPPGGRITDYLRAWEQGDDGALERMLPMVYAELRAIAAKHLGAERPGHTLQPTALANEAYLRLRGLGDVPWHDRSHFFAIASRIMRRLLVDHARARTAHKRGADVAKVQLTEGLHDGLQPALDAAELIDLDRALDELGTEEPRLARLVELRFFGGLEVDEAAALLGCSRRTAMRDWAFARAWLLQKLETPGPAGTVEA